MKFAYLMFRRLVQHALTNVCRCGAVSSAQYIPNRPRVRAAKKTLLRAEKKQNKKY